MQHTLLEWIETQANESLLMGETRDGYTAAALRFRSDVLEEARDGR